MLSSLLSKELHVLLDRLTWQDVHVAILGDVAGLFGLFHGVPREDSGDALKAETNYVIYQSQRPSSNSRVPFTLFLIYNWPMPLNMHIQPPWFKSSFGLLLYAICLSAAPLLTIQDATPQKEHIYKMFIQSCERLIA